VSDTDKTIDQPPLTPAEEALDELLGDAVIYTGEDDRPAEEVAPDLTSLEELTAQAATAPEPRVSWLFWAAAVVWDLPGGLGGWLLLRRTHPRTARRLLVVGIVSFIVVAAAVTTALLVDRALNPSYIYIQK
jgi:hypothetical protein